jgi:hypothetical protein
MGRPRAARRALSKASSVVSAKSLEILTDQELEDKFNGTGRGNAQQHSSVTRPPLSDSDGGGGLTPRAPGGATRAASMPLPETATGLQKFIRCVPPLLHAIPSLYWEPGLSPFFSFVASQAAQPP